VVDKTISHVKTSELVRRIFFYIIYFFHNFYQFFLCFFKPLDIDDHFELLEDFHNIIIFFEIFKKKTRGKNNYDILANLDKLTKLPCNFWES